MNQSQVSEVAHAYSLSTQMEYKDHKFAASQETPPPHKSIYF